MSSIATLRTLLSETNIDQTWSESLCALLKRSHERDPIAHKEIWLPYLASYLEQLPLPLRTCYAVEELAYWHQIIPFPVFAFDTSLLPIFGKESIASNNSHPAFASVHTLNIHAQVPWRDAKTRDRVERCHCSILSLLHLVTLHTLRLEGSGLTPNILYTAIHAWTLRESKRCELINYTLPPDMLERFLHTTKWTQLDTLLLQCANLGKQGISNLLKNPAYHALTTLHIDSNHLSNEDMRAIAHTSKLKQLRHLHIRGSETIKPALGELFAQPLGQQLQSLDIWQVPFDSALAEQLAESPCLSELQLLELSHCKLRDEGLQTILSAAKLPKLRSLDLTDNELSGQSIEQLANTQQLQSLEKLNLSLNPIGDRGANAIASSEHLPSLQKLSLWECEITTKGCLPLSHSKAFPRLQELTLCDNELRSKNAMEAFANSPLLQQLRVLTLGEHTIDEEGLIILSNAPRLELLRELHIYSTTLTGVGLRALASSSSFPALRYLDISDNELKDADIKEAVGKTSLPQLRHLQLESNQLTPHGIRSLLNAPIGRQLHVLELGDNAYDEDIVNAFVPRIQPLSLLRLEIEHGCIGRSLETLCTEPSLPHPARLRWLSVALKEALITEAKKHGIEATTSLTKERMVELVWEKRVEEVG